MSSLRRLAPIPSLHLPSRNPRDELINQLVLNLPTLWKREYLVSRHIAHRQCREPSLKSQRSRHMGILQRVNNHKGEKLVVFLRERKKICLEALAFCGRRGEVIDE